MATLKKGVKLLSLKDNETIKNFMETEDFKEAERQEKRRLKMIVMIKTIREEKGLTQSELANKMHTSQPAVAKMERTGLVSLATIYKFCDALGVDFTFTFSDITSPKRAT